MIIHEFFIVCEGQTDYEVLKAVVAKIGKRKKIKYKTIPLFPPPSNPNRGGWDTLRSFIRAQAGAFAGNQLRLRADAAALLGAKPQANAIRNPNSGDKFATALKLRPNAAAAKIIIQLDTDVAADFQDGTFVVPPQITYPLNSYHREIISNLAVQSWLGGHVQKVGKEIVLCLSTHAIETWILAIYSKPQVAAAIGKNIPSNYDSIYEPDKALLSLGYASESLPGGVKVLRKRKATYIPYGIKLAENLAAAEINSQSLSTFCSSI